MNFAERLKEALMEANLKASDLSKITGIGRPSISEYLKGTYEAKQHNLFKIAKALDVNEAWLMGLDVPKTKYRPEVEMITPVKLHHNEKEKVYAPVLNVAAGAFHSDMSQLEDQIEIPEKLHYLKGKIFAVRINGESMNRIFPNGSTILAEDITQTGYQVKNGDYVVFEHNSEYTIKKMVETSSMVILDPESFDSSFEPMVFNKSEELDLKILGVVKRSFIDFN